MKKIKINFYHVLLILGVITLSIPSCVEVEIPEEPLKELFTEEPDNERGWYGVGIAMIGNYNYVTKEEGCDKPNGICSIAEVMHSVSILSNNTALGYRITGRDNKTLRYEFLNVNEVDSVELERNILEILPNEEKKYADEITNYMKSHYFVPNDLPFSKESTDLILKLLDTEGSLVTAKSGEYKIEKNTDYPFGFFDLEIEIQ